MFGLVFLTCFLGVKSLTRIYIDYDTVVGNCTREGPMFGKIIDGDGDVGCFGKYDMVEMLSFQEIEFIDLSLRIWFSVKHITRVLVFEGYQWIKMKKLILF